MVGVGTALLFFLSGNPHPRPLPGGEGTKGQGKTGAQVTAQYIGSDACASCHSNETAEWKKSQHHDAMAAASEQSMLGNFNGAKFTYAGITSDIF